MQKKIDVQEKIKDMSKRELEVEYQSVCEQIDYGSFGSRELGYQELLEREIDRRGYEIRNNYSLVRTS